MPRLLRRVGVMLSEQRQPGEGKPRPTGSIAWRYGFWVIPQSQYNFFQAIFWPTTWHQYNFLPEIEHQRDINDIFLTKLTPQYNIIGILSPNWTQKSRICTNSCPPFHPKKWHWCYKGLLKVFNECLKVLKFQGNSDKTHSYITSSFWWLPPHPP